MMAPTPQIAPIGFVAFVVLVGNDPTGWVSVTLSTTPAAASAESS